MTGSQRDWLQKRIAFARLSGPFPEGGACKRQPCIAAVSSYAWRSGWVAVRAIPLLTGRKASPDVVAKRLARQGNFGLGQGLGGALLAAGKVGGTTPSARHQAPLLPLAIAAVVGTALNRAGTAPHHTTPALQLLAPVEF